MTALDKVSDGLIREVTLHAFFGVVMGVVSHGEVLIDRSKRATSRTTSDSGASDLTVIWTVNSCRLLLSAFYGGRPGSAASIGEAGTWPSVLSR